MMKTKLGSHYRSSAEPTRRKLSHKKTLTNIISWIPLVVAVAYVLTVNGIDLMYSMQQEQPNNPWEAGQTVEAWRTLVNLPVYEDRVSGHATHFYGALAPYTLGSFMRLTGVNNWSGRLFQLLCSLGVIFILASIAIQKRSPWKFVLAATLLLGIHNISGSYFSQNRPDMAAILLAVLSIWAFYQGYKNNNYFVYLMVGAGLLITAFLHKQTMAIVALIPILPILLDNTQKISKRLIFSISPLAAIVATIIVLRLWFPIVYSYMVEIPRQYAISLTRLIIETTLFFASLPLFLALFLWWILRTQPCSYPRWWPWLLWSLIITLPTSAVAVAKAGGGPNSWLPALFSIMVFCIVLLNDMLDETVSSNHSWRKKCLIIATLSTLIVTTFPYPYRLHHPMENNFRDYEEVINYIEHNKMTKSISPEDPTITVYALGKASRNIYLEFDATKWPNPFPSEIIDELQFANHVIDVNNWHQNLLKPQHLRDLGFLIEKEFRHYTIWTKQKTPGHPP